MAMRYHFTANRLTSSSQALFLLDTSWGLYFADPSLTGPWKLGNTTLFSGFYSPDLPTSSSQQLLSLGDEPGVGGE